MDSVKTYSCEYLERGVCNCFCFLRAKKHGMKPRTSGDGTIDYNECEVIKELNKSKIINYAF